MTLGGCTYVFQLDRAKLAELLQLWMPLQGRAMITPFRLVTPVPSGPAAIPRSPSLDLVIDNVDVALDAGADTGRLLLRVKAGAIRLAGHPALAAKSGTVSIALKFVRGTLLTVRKLSASFQDLRADGADAIPDFLSLASAEADHLLDVGDRNAETEIFPDDDPSIANLLKLAVALGGTHRISDAETFCTVINAPTPAPVPRFIEPGRSVALGQSADTIKETLLRPSLQQQLLDPSDPNAELPPPWDNGKIGRDQDGAHVDITRLDITFADGYLDVTGQFNAHDDCWSVSGGTFSQQMYLDYARASHTVISRMVPPSPTLNYDVHVKFLCRLIEFATAAVTGLVGAFIYGLAFIVTVEIIKASVSPSVAPSTPTRVPLDPPLRNAEWISLRIIPEGGIVQGDISVYLAAPIALAPRVTFTTTESVELVGASQGQVTVQAPSCEARVFDYTEVGQVDSFTFDAVPLLLIEPITYTWRIDGTVLATNAGTWSATGTVVAALPPPTGTEIANHPIELAYRIGPEFSVGLRPTDSLWIQARPADVNYSLYIEVDAVDAVGQNCANAFNVHIVGDALQLGPEYYAYMADCIRKTRDYVNRKGRRQVTPKPGDPQERLGDLVAQIVDHLRAGNVEAQALVAAAVQAHGAVAVSGEMARQLNVNA